MNSLFYLFLNLFYLSTRALLHLISVVSFVEISFPAGLCRCTLFVLIQPKVALMEKWIRARTRDASCLVGVSL